MPCPRVTASRFDPAGAAARENGHGRAEQIPNTLTSAHTVAREHEFARAFERAAGRPGAASARRGVVGRDCLADGLGSAAGRRP